MSKTITWDWFMANRNLDRRVSGDGRVLYSASINLDGWEYVANEFEYLPDADANLIERIAAEGYTVDGYTPPEDSPTHDPVNSPAHYKQGEKVETKTNLERSEDMTDKKKEIEIIDRIRSIQLDANRLGVQSDPVHSPTHYKQGDIECIDAIKAALTAEEFRGYCKGNALKYIWRAEHKGKPSEDIKKAIWYLNRLGGEYDG